MNSEINLGRSDQAFTHAHNAIKSAKDVASAVFILQQNYEMIAHVTYHLGHTISNELVDAPFVRTTYPDKWVARYLLKGYVTVDPILREGLTRRLPFFWSQVDTKHEHMELFRDFYENGFGLEGYCVPITDKNKRHAVVAINAPLDSKHWERYVATHQTDWINLANLIHRKAIIELHGQNDPMPQMSPREIEVLYWASRGKEAKDIAIILDISEHTVRAYTRSVRFKLDCANLTQAVAKAAMLHLI